MGGHEHKAREIRLRDPEGDQGRAVAAHKDALAGPQSPVLIFPQLAAAGLLQHAGQILHRVPGRGAGGDEVQ